MVKFTNKNVNFENKTFSNFHPLGFKRRQTSVQKFDPKNYFSNDELPFILKRRNLEICEHSSF